MNRSVWGPAQQEMSELLQGHPDDVPAVIDQLTELQDILGRVAPALPENALCDFNKLYLTITESILERLYAGRFRDPAFVSRLDVEFAARYFDALRAWRGPEASPRCPRVWCGLFGHLAGAGVLPSACAGINAHINFDLPFALVTTFDHLGTDPIDDSDQHHDYRQINQIFGAAVPGLRSGYLDRWQVLVETMNGRLDDCGPGEETAYAQNVAWRTAQKLWGMRHDMTATDRERTHLDRTSADLGRLLLSPHGAFLH
ncbi:MAG TPA: DUF5995 family protein [Actinoplanes sp.]|jgi:hypothetical protein